MKRANTDLIGPGADEVRRNVRSVLFEKKCTDLCDSHSSGAHSDDLVVETRCVGAHFWGSGWARNCYHDHGDIQPQGAITSQHRLAALAIALVDFILRALPPPGG